MIAVIKDGTVINIGAWELEFEDGTPNPFPDGAIEGDFDICKTADGRHVIADNYELLRRAEYPSIRDQLDALFHAGVFPDEMAEKLRAVKEKHPKPAEPQ